jgi:hypothetical protein
VADKYAGPLTDGGEIYLWEHYTMRENQADGIIASLRDDVYPEGWNEGPIRGKLVGNNPRQIVQAWFGHVSGRLNAWKNSQEIASAERAEASRTRREQEAAAAPVMGGGEVSASPYQQDGEASLEATLRSKVAALSRSVVSIEAEITRTLESLTLLQQRRAGLEQEVWRAEQALTFVAGDSPPENSPVNNPEGAVISKPRRGRPAGSKDSKPRVRKSKNKPAETGLGLGILNSGE